MFLVVICSSLISVLSFGQGFEDGCGLTTPPANLPNLFSNCTAPPNPDSPQDNRYLPLATDPIKEVRLNFVFLHRPADPINGIEASLEQSADYQAFIDDVIEYMNFRMGSFKEENAPNECAENTLDTRIRFDVKKTFLSDYFAWNNENDNCQYGCPDLFGCPWYINYVSDNLNMVPDNEKAINVFFTENETIYEQILDDILVPQNQFTVDCSMYNSTDLDKNLKIHMRNEYTKHKWMQLFALQNDVTWEMALSWQLENVTNLILHEIGHCFYGEHIPTCNIMHPNGGYQKYHLRQQQIQELHRALSTYNVRKYVNDCISNWHPIEINSNETWNYDIKLYGNVVVKPGNTLTIRCNVRMPTEGKIIVQRGAKLIIDGGTITHTCGSRWGGIEVWGNTDVASRHQLYFNAAYTNDNLPPITDYETAPIPLTGPGVVVLKNNALLEYGPLGTIVTQRTGGDYPNHYGGIVVAQDATFLNCKKGVGFMKYRYENYSYFSRCHFISNNNNLPNAKFEGITAWACNGIVVDDCTFDYQTTANTTNDRFGIITADNLNLIVRNKCKFNYLNQAISLGANNYLNGSATITDNLFEYNQIGISNLATSSMVATGNQFTGNSSTHQGISIGGTCAYTIANNLFSELQAGVAVWFTSYDTPGNNLINCNTYTKCKFGNYLNDDNTGLQLLDNDFNTQTADNKLDNGVNNGTIAFSQGNLDAPHFNLFSTNTATQHFKAPAGQTDLFVYFYHTDNDNYTPEVNARLVPKCDAASACTPVNNFINFDVINLPSPYLGCLDLNGDGIAGMAAPNPDDCQTKECYYATKAYLDNLKSEIDGGDKADLLNSPYNSPEALATYQKYMAASPYLSDEVLITAAQTDLMSPNHRANILLSNAPLSDEAMYQIQDLVAENVYQLLYTIKYYTKFSARDNLNLSISRESAKKEELLHNLLQKFADEKDYAQLDEVLTAENTTYAVRSLLSSKTERKHYTDAQAMLSYLPTTTPDEEDYKTIQQINLQRLSATAEGFELTDEQYQQLRTIALAYGTQAPYAQTLLGLLRGEYFDWQIPEDDTESGKTDTHPRYKDVALLGKEVLNRLTVTPNPANNSINVALPTYLSEQPAVLNIYNLSGKLLKTLSIDKEQNTANIVTTDLPNGIYLVSYIADGITLSSTKVVVQH